jgi:hypothetical protein
VFIQQRIHVYRRQRPAPYLGRMRRAASSSSESMVAVRVVSVAWQQVCLGAHHAGARCDVHVDGDLLRFFIGDDLVKTAARTSRGEVKNKRAFRTCQQA